MGAPAGEEKEGDPGAKKESEEEEERRGTRQMAGSESLSFDRHWKSRVEKARKMLGALAGMGGSQWGISPSSW